MAIKAKKSGQDKSEDRRGSYYSNRGNTALRESARKLGLSLQDIAGAIGRKRHAVWKWLHGMSRPVLEIRIQIQKEFDIPTGWWLTTEERKQKKESLKELERVSKGKKMTKPQLRLQKQLQDALGSDEK